MPLPFKPHTTSFSADNALYLATASSIAYMGSEVSERRAAEELGLDQDFCFFNFPMYDTEAFAAATPEHAVLAFRGTEPERIKDWMTDLDATPVGFRWLFTKAEDVGFVHAGFAHALYDAWSPIIYWLKAHGPETGRTLWITGHSLGGALAAVAASACAFDPGSRLDVNGIYTYGQPRFAIHDFAGHYDEQLRRRHFRFVNRKDLVPRVPFRGWDYADPGQMIHFDSSGVPRLESPEWNSFLSRSIQSFSEFFSILTHFGGDIADHSIEDGYIASIRPRLADLDALPFR
jgi:triacylglycerol lipase